MNAQVFNLVHTARPSPWSTTTHDVRCIELTNNTGAQIDWSVSGMTNVRKAIPSTGTLPVGGTTFFTAIVVDNTQVARVALRYRREGFVYDVPQFHINQV